MAEPFVVVGGVGVSCGGWCLWFGGPHVFAKERVLCDVDVVVVLGRRGGRHRANLLLLRVLLECERKGEGNVNGDGDGLGVK